MYSTIVDKLCGLNNTEIPFLQKWSSFNISPNLLSNFSKSEIDSNSLNLFHFWKGKERGL